MNKVIIFRFDFYIILQCKKAEVFLKNLDFKIYPTDDVWVRDIRSIQEMCYSDIISTDSHRVSAFSSYNSFLAGSFKTYFAYNTAF
ncbi:hypothetical protein [Chryseobacterium sp. 18068]|uniref:hypothetical protein n=1 Tax=Chryseobacterium sp. 18068 TaxID=2681414 RepID=UPI001357AD6A|nr:hypothetical protein [Chryseobacterium sp. 18068]